MLTAAALADAIETCATRSSSNVGGFGTASFLRLSGYHQVVPTEKSVLVAAVDVAADDGYASGR